MLSVMAASVTLPGQAAKTLRALLGGEGALPPSLTTVTIYLVPGVTWGPWLYLGVKVGVVSLCYCISCVPCSVCVMSMSVLSSAVGGVPSSLGWPCWVGEAVLCVTTYHP